MRVLHLVNTLSHPNGIVNVVVDLSITQVIQGDDVVVASAGGHYAAFLEARGVHVESIAVGDRSPQGVVRSVWQARRLVLSFRPDVIHAHTVTAVLVARLLFAGVPIIATVHNEWQRSSYLMRFADRAVGVSQAVTKAMIARGVPADRLRTVCNATVGSPREPADIVPKELSHPAVVFVGALTLMKGIDVLVEAFAKVHQRLPEAHLYLVGNNDLPLTDDAVSALGIDGVVHIMGAQDPYPYYAAADLFVLPSRAEAAGLALLEAMGMGVASIGSRVGGMADFLDEEGGGLTFPSEDVQALADLIVRCLTDDQLRADLSRRAREVAQHHTVETLARQYRDVYEELLR